MVTSVPIGWGVGRWGEVKWNQTLVVGNGEGDSQARLSVGDAESDARTDSTAGGESSGQAR